MRVWCGWRHNKGTSSHTNTCTHTSILYLAWTGNNEDGIHRVVCGNDDSVGERETERTRDSKECAYYNVFSITCQNMFFRPTLARSFVSASAAVVASRTASFMFFGITKMGRLITWETEHRRTHYAFKWKFVECECVIDDDAAPLSLLPALGHPRNCWMLLPRCTCTLWIHVWSVRMNEARWFRVFSKFALLIFFSWYLLTFPHYRALSSTNGNPVNCLHGSFARRKLLILPRVSIDNWLPKLIELNRCLVTVKKQFALNRFHFSKTIERRIVLAIALNRNQYRSFWATAKSMAIDYVHLVPRWNSKCLSECRSSV